MKRLIAVITALILIVVIYSVGDDNHASEVTEDDPKIGLLQLVSHPSLDQITNGIIDELEKEGFVDGETMDLDFQNAQGDQNNMNTMSNRFVNNHVDVMIGIATPAVQALTNSSSDIPIVMGAVTDPINAGLVDNLDKPGGNITGVRDVTPYQEQVDLITEILPDIETLGIIYSNGEVNSVKQSEETKEYAESLGIEVIEATITSTNDLQQVGQHLVDQVDAIWVGTDNNVASAFPTLIEVANGRNVPVFPAVAEMVQEGGIATQGLNQYELGVLTGRMVVQVLQGADPATLAVEDPSETELIINTTQAELLGIELNDSTIESADQIIEEEN